MPHLPVMRGVAKERIPYGAEVRCRQMSVELVPGVVANGIAKAPPKWGQNYDQCYEAGEWVVVEPLADWTGRNLQALADGPIMEPLKLYLPAGKLTEAEYQERLDLQFADAGLKREGREQS